MVASASALQLGTAPIPRTRLIGRESERATARALLVPGAVPLLSLTGPGGVGKTRLALAVAEDVAAAFADGVVWIDLAPLVDPDLVPATVATALGVISAPDTSLIDDLARALRPRQVLLLLDNCEHVLPATAELVTALLSRCPALQVLATSRAPLRLRGEQLLRVEPLAVPLAEEPAMDAIARNAAVRLFVERARAVHPAFALTHTNAPTVAEVCRNLDGLPLAIELAAARIAILSPEALVAALTDRLRMLRGGPRDLPTRQQTIHATIAWSYALLDGETQALFRRLAVFLNGFTLEAAQAVSDGTQAAADVMTGLTALVEQSLIRRLDGVGEPRFAMLETIREYGLERLDEAGERARAQDAHAAFFIAFAERSDRQLASGDERIDSLLRRIEVEQANIRAALTRLADVGDADGTLRLSSAMAVAWQFHMNLREGRQWLEWGLAHTAKTATVPRGRALAGLALLLWVQGRYEEARPLAEASFGIAKQLHDTEIAAYAIHRLGLVAMSQHLWERAKTLLEQVLGLWRELGYRAFEAFALLILAAVDHGLGADEVSTRHASEALALFREIGHATGAATALTHLAELARNKGDDRGAAVAYAEALEVCTGIGERFALGHTVAGLAELASRHAQAEVAAALIGALDTLAQEAGATRLPGVGLNYGRATTAALAALDTERFAELQAAGQRLRRDEAIRLAGMVAIPAIQSSNAGIPSAHEPHVDGLATEKRAEPLVKIAEFPPVPAATIGLTFREQEVLGLLCQRLTDAEIAQHLFISHRTASSHVSHILAKLGAANRREAAALAARSGLV